MMVKIHTFQLFDNFLNFLVKTKNKNRMKKNIFLKKNLFYFLNPEKQHACLL